MKNKFLKISFSFLAFLLMFSCDSNDDYTNDSVVKAVSPSLAVSLSFANETTLIEQEASYMFSVAITEAQIADVIVNLAQTDGTATAGEDFTMPSSVTIKRGTLSASGEITILADELPEETETVTIQIGLGNESNVSGVTSETVTFNIANLTDGDLVVGMSWAASSTVTNNYGEEIDAYALADLRLLLTDSPYTTVYDAADGAGAESYVLSGAAPDGEYSFVADFYAANYEIEADLNLTLTFDQVGVINGQTHSFAAALSTLDVCADLNYVMAKITKSGNSYSFEEVGEKSSFNQNIFAGTYSEVSDSNVNGWLTAGATMTAGTLPGELIVAGIYEGLFEYWGESFQPGFGNEGLVKIYLNSDGTVTLPNQYAGQTEPGPYDYYYNGSGTYNVCEKTITLSFAMQFDETFSDDYQPATIVFKLD